MVSTPNDYRRQSAKGFQTCGRLIILKGYCMLFPCFFLGVASTVPNDRQEITAEFERLQGWSGLENLKLAHNVVNRLWDAYDSGLARPWDWMMHKDLHGISVPVTEFESSTRPFWTSTCPLQRCHPSALRAHRCPKERLRTFPIAKTSSLSSARRLSHHIGLESQR